MTRAIVSLLLALTVAPLSAHPPSIYAGYATPEYILHGIACAESSEQDHPPDGDGGISRGRMQLNKRYDSERAAKWGAFDPYCATDAVRIADCILMENLRLLGSWPMAITAYRWGVTGALRHGIDWEYLRKCGYKVRGVK